MFGLSRDLAVVQTYGHGGTSLNYNLCALIRTRQMLAQIYVSVVKKSVKSVKYFVVRIITNLRLQVISVHGTLIRINTVVIRGFNANFERSHISRLYFDLCCLKLYS